MTDPNKRTLVAGFGWIRRTKSLKPDGTFWVDFTKGGAAGAAQILADLRANETDPSIRYAYAQYHLYFEDGGHVRYTLQYDLETAETLYNFYDPAKAAMILAPTPEFWTQEGITNADEWRATLA